MHAYTSQNAQRAREKLFLSIQRTREEVLDWKAEADRRSSQRGPAASLNVNVAQRVRPRRPPSLPGPKTAASPRHAHLETTLRDVKPRAEIHKPGRGSCPEPVALDTRCEDEFTVFKLHPLPPHHAALYNQDERGFRDTEAHAMWYVGAGKTEWRPCTLRDFQGHRYLLSWRDDPEARTWVAWTRVWRSDQESLAAHQTRMTTLRSAIAASVQTFITDAGVPGPAVCAQEACDPHGPFLAELVGPITSQMVIRLVLKAKPLLRPFRTRIPHRYGASTNSRALWRHLLEEVHDAFLHAQYLAGVRWRLKDVQPNAEQNDAAVPGQSKVRQLVRALSARAFIADAEAVRAMRKVHATNLDFETETVLFDLSFVQRTVQYREFAARQDIWIDRVGAKTRSSWIVAIYDILLQHIVHKPRFAQNTGPSGDLARFLRLTQLSIRETLARIVSASLDAFERAFAQGEVRIFSVDVRLERLTRARAMYEEQISKRRTKARQRLTMLSEDWIMMDCATTKNSSLKFGRGNDEDAEDDEEAGGAEIAAANLNEIDRFKVELIPSCDACIEAVQACVRQAIVAVQRFPRIDALVLDNPYTPETESIDLSALIGLGKRPKEVVERISQSLAVSANASDSQCQRICNILDQRIENLGALDKSRALEDLREELKSEQSFGVFALHVGSLKDRLQQEADQIRNQHLGRVLADTLERCARITSDYEEARAKLAVVARSAGDLQRVIEELARVPAETAALEARIAKEIEPQYALFAREQYIMAPNDWAAYWRVAGLPKKLSLRAERVRSEIESRKADIRSELEDVITRHRKRLAEYDRLADLMAKYEDLRRTEEFAMNASLLEENVVAAHEKTEELGTRCATVGLQREAAEILTISRSLVDRVRPIAALWTAAADVSEMHAMWHRGSLLKLDVNETIERARCIVEETLPRGEAFTTHTVTRWVRARVQEIYESERLVRALTSRGLQHYHWASFAENHGLPLFQPTYETTLEKVARSHPHVLDHLDDLATMAELASAEFRHEQLLDDMETQLKRLVDDTDTEVWRLEVLVADHMSKIHEMRLDPRIESLLPRMRVWEERITERLASAFAQAQECRRARMQVIASWRRHEPRLCFLSDEDLLGFFSPPRLCDVAEDILRDVRTSPQLQDPFKVLQLLYAWYALPAIMQKTAKSRKRNLFAEGDAHADKQQEDQHRKQLKATRESAALLGSGRAAHSFLTIFNHAHEHFPLPAPCSALSLDGVDHFVGSMLKEKALAALGQLRALLESAQEDDGCISTEDASAWTAWAGGLQKQVAVLAVRIVLSEISADADEEGRAAKQRRLLDSLVAAQRSFAQKLGAQNAGGPEARRQVRMADTLVAIAQNHAEVSATDPEAIFRFSYDETCDSVKISFEDYSLYHGFEIVQTDLPPLLYSPSMRWHFAVTRVFHRASESILLAEQSLDQVATVASELGYHCRSIACESLEDLMRVQQGVRRTKWWVVLLDRCGWGNLVNFSPDPRHLVVASRKPRLPPAVSAKLRPCAINVNPSILQAQGILARDGDGGAKSPLPKQMSASSCKQDSTHQILQQQGTGDLASKTSDQLALYMTEFSDAREWERRIKRFLRRVSQNTWSGAPSRIVIHDAQRADGALRNADCMDLLARLQSPELVVDVDWVFVNRHNAMAPHVANASEIPASVSCLTLVLLDSGVAVASADPGDDCGDDGAVFSPSQRREMLAHLVDIPGSAALQAANDRGKSEALKIVCFEDSAELSEIENDFPRVRRTAARVRVSPWWLSREAIMRRSSVEDEVVAGLLAEGFLRQLLGPRTRPEEFFELESRVREALPPRMGEATKICQTLTREVEALSTSSDSGSEAAVAAKQAALSRALEDLQDAPRKLIDEVCEAIVRDRAAR